MCLWTYGWNLLHCVLVFFCFFLFPLIACFCWSGLLSCSQIRCGDLSKCCRVLQLRECHLITRALCVTSCCVLEEAGSPFVPSARLIDWLLAAKFEQFSVSRLAAGCTCFFFHLFFFLPFPPVAWIGSVKQTRFPNPENLNAYTWGASCFLHFIPTACRTAYYENKKTRRKISSWRSSLSLSKELFYLPYASFCWQSWHKVVLLTWKIFSQDVFSAHARFRAFFVQVLLRSARSCNTSCRNSVLSARHLAQTCSVGQFKMIFAQYSERHASMLSSLFSSAVVQTPIILNSRRLAHN